MQNTWKLAKLNKANKEIKHFRVFVFFSSNEPMWETLEVQLSHHTETRACKSECNHQVGRFGKCGASVSVLTMGEAKGMCKVCCILQEGKKVKGLSPGARAGGLTSPRGGLITASWGGLILFTRYLEVCYSPPGSWRVTVSESEMIPVCFPELSPSVPTLRGPAK